MADEPAAEVAVEPVPGWSNNPPGDAVVEEVEPQELNIGTPGWSNNPAGAGSPSYISGILAPPGWSNYGPAATGATAGTPGSYTPAGAMAPLTLSAMTGVTASPATAWTTGQYVSLRDGTQIHWSSTAWVAGKA